jgi:hypothetical protein
MLQKNGLEEIKFPCGEKSLALALQMPVPAEDTVPPGASAVCSNENVNFTTSKMQRLPVKKVPVRRWIKDSWNQPIKNSKEKYAATNGMAFATYFKNVILTERLL